MKLKLETELTVPKNAKTKAAAYTIIDADTTEPMTLGRCTEIALKAVAPSLTDIDRRKQCTSLADAISSTNKEPKADFTDEEISIMQFAIDKIWLDENTKNAALKLLA